eukprot:g29645.t1
MASSGDNLTPDPETEKVPFRGLQRVLVEVRQVLKEELHVELENRLRKVLTEEMLPLRLDLVQRQQQVQQMQLQEHLRAVREHRLTLSEGDLVKKVLDDALAGVPLPTPWEVIETEGGSYFNQKTTGETTWNHPLQAHLEELSALALRCLGLKPKERWQAAKLLRQRFQVEAEREYQCWYAAEDGSSGSCYFCHRDTGDAMKHSSNWWDSWEHPAGVVLPQFYLKIRCAELLLDDEYLRGLREAEDPPSPEGRLGRTISKLLGIRSTSKESLKSQATPFGSSCSTASRRGADEKGIESDEECAREVALMVDRWVEEP